MPERPLLILPSPGRPLPPQKKRGGGGKFHFPSPERQIERLSPKFDRLQRTMDERRVRLMMEARDIVPEEVAVLETAATVDEFIRAVERVEGMEWLAEVETEEIPPDDDFFAVNAAGERRRDKGVRGRVFMVFTNQDALRQMISLWRRWSTAGRMPQGLGRWKTLFEQLRDVRFWGAKERLHETGILEDWRARVDDGQECVPCEIELWCRRDQAQRSAARNRVVDLVNDMGGRLIAESEIAEIAYQALSVELPIIQVHPLLERGNFDIDLIQCEQIQFFRASGQMFASSEAEPQDLNDNALPEEPRVGEPVVALFDGLPMQAHSWLRGRLDIDDPDGFEQDYPASTRKHGTAMASLILHGDLAADEAPLPRRLYVRPILRQNPGDWRNNREAVPDETLEADLIHRAVRRLFERDGGEAPVAPQVSIINLSIGIADRPFDQILSPLARLIDWLAWRYKVLFVVSAGNHYREIKLIPAIQPQQQMPIGIQERVVRAIAADTRNRRLLSPAEAVNALTVASTHDDASRGQPLAPRWSDPYGDAGLPSPFNAQGMGYRRGIKPDLLAAGGRTAVQTAPGREDSLMLYDMDHSPGQLAASPGPNPGNAGGAQHSRGTSNAAALVSRACGFLYDELDRLRRDPGGELIDHVPRSVWIKALIAHGAEWGDAGSILTGILKNQDNSRQFREYITRLIGYGAVDVSRVAECTSSRVTAFSGGTLEMDESHIHRFPLPPSLSRWGGKRRLIITLAWLSPVNPRHQVWRRAALSFESSGDPLQVKRKQADSRAATRGTLQHEILEGKRADEFADNAKIEIKVNCRAGAGAFAEEIPYALAVTLEVAEPLNADIYAEVRTAIHAVHVRPEAAIGP